MKYSKKDLIDYRIKRAYESVEEAKLLAKEGHWNSVANRLYYACFYVVNALIVKHNLTVHTHSGIKSEFHKRFIKSGIIEMKFGKHYSNMFDKRQEADYQAFRNFTAKEIEPLIDVTYDFIRATETLIHASDK
ncbi:HEPN domain-containing protein [Bacteroidota bacterium]